MNKNNIFIHWHIDKINAIDGRWANKDNFSTIYLAGRDEDRAVILLNNFTGKLSLSTCQHFCGDLSTDFKVCFWFYYLFQIKVVKIIIEWK